MGKSSSAGKWRDFSNRKDGLKKLYWETKMKNGGDGNGEIRNPFAG
jgi:hypothetical protein